MKTWSWSLIEIESFLFSPVAGRRRWFFSLQRDAHKNIRVSSSESGKNFIPTHDDNETKTFVGSEEVQTR